MPAGAERNLIVKPRPTKVWVVSESKAGTMTQCMGVGLYLDNQPKQKIVKKAGGLKRYFQRPLYSTHEQRPDVIISCGFMPEERVIKMRASFERAPLAVHLQPPKIEGYDLVFVSRHDWNDKFEARQNYHAMIGVPHRITSELVASRRDAALARYAVTKGHTVAVFVGGSNGAYEYDDATLSHIADIIKKLETDGWKVLVSVSRRSDEKTLKSLLLLRTARIEVWDRLGENPYLDYLAAADAFLIAKDSVTMPCEALATGKPVYTVDLTPIPGSRLEKFERYHRDLEENLRLTRKFSGDLSAYAYSPLNETLRLAEIIRANVAAR
jgi:mitochondrial fission protein ELM1